MIDLPSDIFQCGHFRYESGDHGDVWLNLDRLFVDARRMRGWALTLADVLSPTTPQVIVGALTGGAFLANVLAAEMGVAFVFSQRVVLEGGEVRYRIPDTPRETLHGKTCLLVDDAINAGSALRGTLADVLTCGGRIVGIGSLIVMGEAAERIAAEQGVPFQALARVERQMWRAEHCPLCANGVPLTPSAATSPQ